MSSGSPEPRRSPRALAAIALRYLCDGCNTAKRKLVDGVENWRRRALLPQVAHQAEILRLSMDHWLIKQVERYYAYGFACFGRRDLSRPGTLGSAGSSDEPSTLERQSMSRSNASPAQPRATDAVALNLLDQPMNRVQSHESRLMGNLTRQSNGAPALDTINPVALGCTLTAAPAGSAASGRRGSWSVFTDAGCPAPGGVRAGSQAASLVVETMVPQLTRCGQNAMYRSTGVALCAG
jgi:hypothetical protein